MYHLLDRFQNHPVENQVNLRVNDSIRHYTDKVSDNFKMIQHVHSFLYLQSCIGLMCFNVSIR